MKDIPRDALCVAVHDGDSCTLNIEYPFDLRQWVVRQEVIRLYGIQAAELVGPLADKAKAAREFLASQILGKRVLVQKMGNDKFGGREDAVIMMNGSSINDLMVTSGNAVKWDGKGPKPLG